MYKSPVSPQKLWIEQCTAAEVIRERFGLQKALQYLVGEKFLSFVWQSEQHPSLAADLPAFVTEIRRIFHPGKSQRTSMSYDARDFGKEKV